MTEEEIKYLKSEFKFYHLKCVELDEQIESLKKELADYQHAVENAVAIFRSIVRDELFGDYPQDDLLSDAKEYIKGVEFKQEGKK